MIAAKNAALNQNLRPRATVDVCVELLQKPPTREEAVTRLVTTFRPEVQEAQLERWTMTTLDGTPIAFADARYLRAEAVGIMAWALERENVGAFNQGAWTWIEAAKAALGGCNQVRAPVSVASAYRGRAVLELVAALPKDERLKALNQFGANLIDGRHESLVTPDELKADAKALRACARDWRLGHPSDPASRVKAPPTIHATRATPVAHGAV